MKSLMALKLLRLDRGWPSVAALLLILSICLAACGGGGSGSVATARSVDSMNDLSVPQNFDYATTTRVTFNFEVVRDDSSSWDGVVVILLAGDTGEEIELARCVTGQDGTATVSKDLAIHLREVVVKTSAVGIGNCTITLSKATEITCVLSRSGNSWS